MAKDPSKPLKNLGFEPVWMETPNRTVRPLVRLNKFHKNIQTNLEDAEAGVAMSDVGF